MYGNLPISKVKNASMLTAQLKQILHNNGTVT